MIADIHLTTQNLDIGYSHALAQNLELSLKSGEFVCLVGVNGSGKSTLLRTLCGAQKPLKGQVVLNQHCLSTMSSADIAQSVGVVLTDKVQVSHLSVESLIAMGRHPHTGWFGKLSEADLDAIEQAIEQTQLQSLRHREISSLSDGQRQKVMMARVLAQQTPLILLDEPTAFLDLTQRVEMAFLLRQFAHEQGHGILMSTHDLELTLQMADQVWVLDPPHLHMGSPEDLVLSKTFQSLFDSAHVQFDSDAGRFQIHKKASCPVRLESLLEEESNPLFWTNHALERRGFWVCGDNDPSVPQISLQMQGKTPHWHLQFQQETYVASCLSQMLNQLEKWKGSL